MSELFRKCWQTAHEMYLFAVGEDEDPLYTPIPEKSSTDPNHLPIYWEERDYHRC